MFWFYFFHLTLTFALKGQTDTNFEFLKKAATIQFDQFRYKLTQNFEKC